MGTGAATAIFFRALLALVLLGAGIAKVVDGRERLLRVIEDYRLLPRPAAAATAALLPWVEISTGLLLWTGVWARAAAVSAALLFVGFASGVAVNLLRGRTDIACGCFGSITHGLSWSIVARNAGLAVIGGFSALSGVAGVAAGEALPVALSATAVVLMGLVLRAVRNVRLLDFGALVPEGRSHAGGVVGPSGVSSPSTTSFLPLTSPEDWSA
ncbi:MAG: methylamine utilization protein MauE [Actinomycetota bacterium]|nr:methylamine utilization protein MauE [Actinomycetota bacterium]